VSESLFSSLRCKVGLHKPTDTKIEMCPGMGAFGGTMTVFHWRCARCGTRGSTWT
jgi:hypothetical protein